MYTCVEKSDSFSLLFHIANSLAIHFNADNVNYIIHFIYIYIYIYVYILYNKHNESVLRPICIHDHPFTHASCSIVSLFVYAVYGRLEMS